MKLLKDDAAVTYGLIMFIVALALAIFAWMFVGPVIDLLEETFNSMSYLYSDTMGNRVTDIVNSYSYLPFFFLVTGVVYLFIRGLQRKHEENI